MLLILKVNCNYYKYITFSEMKINLARNYIVDFLILNPLTIFNIIDTTIVILKWILLKLIEQLTNDYHVSQFD